jgi:preprotein translocase subunit SecA
MSSDVLPQLVLFPERRERGDSWQVRVETAFTRGPMIIRSFARRPLLNRFLVQINQLEAGLLAMDDAMLRARIDELRGSLRRRGFRNDVLVPAFAIIRETARRRIGLRHYDVQLRAGHALLTGMVAEMDTGEGKTLAATLAAATAALAGIPVHVVTVNDYLARRDAETMKSLYHALGLRVGVIVHGLQPAERRAAYGCDIVYASNKEIAFDYLRDRLALGNQPRNLALKLARLKGRTRRTEGTVMRGLHFAIVDEADSVLIDEARTPLIISRETDAKDEQRWAEEALELSAELVIDEDYRIHRDDRRIELTRRGRERLTGLAEARGGIWLSRIRREESVRQALSARHLFHGGDQYLIQDGKIKIVDEYTGRIMADRSWSEGLHQLVEAKEGCAITGRKLPVAQMTYQRFFRRYQRLAGMTGTAREVAGEFWSVYRLPVVRIPTHRPSLRQRYPIRVFRSMDDKWHAIVRRTAELNQQGRPVLIGTRSVATSETISRWLSDAGLVHVVLNAAQDRAEAEVIANAGKCGRITVATNMAGRGVDIRLEEDIKALGGLHVILSERHDARRIDRQLEGRCARQGDPGSTEAMLSLEDSLAKLVVFDSMHRLALVSGPAGYWGGQLLFHLAQRRAERSHTRARHDLMKLDMKRGSLLAFSGGME